MEMKKDTILKRMYFIIALFCIAPVLTYFINSFVFGPWQYFPLAISTLIGCIIAILVSYYFSEKNIF